MTEYPSYSLSTPLCSESLANLHETFDSVWGPVADHDGTHRLQQLDKNTSVDFGKICRLPLKKLLLPANQSVWRNQCDVYSRTTPTKHIAVIGLPLCELQGAWYLDQVFAEEKEYQQRRAKIVLIGTPCEPKESCRCHYKMPFCGGYFISEQRLWLIGDKPQLLPGLENMVVGDVQNRPLPVPAPMANQVETCTIDQFINSNKAALWQEESQSCLSCGACSAVCPTCYCFDLLDDLKLNGEVNRLQVWDNCFFPEHAQVAGGHNFRASRAERLRFRFEHKKFGFGSLRGVNSCTGCGRCDEACPVGITLERVNDALIAEAPHAQ